MTDARSETHRSISWYTCNCEWISKYCDENHTARASVPLSLLNSLVWVGDDEGTRGTLGFAWWEGVNAQWKHRPIGNRIPETENPFHPVSDPQRKVGA